MDTFVQYADAWYIRMGSLTRFVEEGSGNLLHFSNWLGVEVANPQCLQTVKDLHAWLATHGLFVQLQVSFVAEHAKEIFEVLGKIQIASVPTFAIA